VLGLVGSGNKTSTKTRKSVTQISMPALAKGHSVDNVVHGVDRKHM